MNKVYKLSGKRAEKKNCYLNLIKFRLYIQCIQSNIVSFHKQNLPTMLLLYISAIVICLTWHAGIKLGLDANQVSFRYYLYAIPIALSRILGNVNDYTPFNELGALFNHSAGDLNTLIKHALTLKPLSNAKPLYFISGDDKGLADITSLAFSIFGLKQQSLYHNFFFILSSSALIFALQFYKSFEKCLVLFVILISLYVCIYTFSISDQANSIIEPRFIGFLSIIPLFHLIFSLTEDIKLSFGSIMYQVLQGLIIILVFHARSSEIWVIPCIIFFTIVSIFIFLFKRKSSLEMKNKYSVLLRIIPCIMLGCLICCLNIYKLYVYNPGYFNKYSSSHVFWHTALTGLGVDPYLADKYHLSALNDLQTSIAVNLYLEEIGNKKLRHTLFGKPSYFGGNWQNFNWALYEPVARELYFKIARENPISVIKVYLKIMPEVFYENILYLSGMKSTDKEQDYIEGALLSKHERDTKNLYYKLLRPEVSILLIMGIILYIVNDYRFIKKSNNAHIFCSTLIVAIFSFMPCMLIVPTLQYIQVFLTLLTTLFYLGFIIVIKNAGYRLIYICDKVSYHISLLMPRSYLL